MTCGASAKAEMFMVMEWRFWNYLPPLARSLWIHRFLAMGIDATSLLGHACLLTKVGNMRFSPLAYGTQRLVKISKSLHLVIMCPVDILSASPSLRQLVKRLTQLQHPALS